MATSGKRGGERLRPVADVTAVDVYFPFRKFGMRWIVPGIVVG